MRFHSRLTVSALALVWSALACGASPLLNHRDAQINPGTGTHALLADPRCAFSFPARNLCAELVWLKDPAVDPMAEVQVRFAKADDLNGPYVDPGFEVGLKLWMPAMGHGSTPVRVSPELDARGAAVTGVYRGTPVYFVMGGAWEIWLQLKSGAKIVDQVAIPYTAP